MSRTIPAIYDAGVFRPLEKVELAAAAQTQQQINTLKHQLEKRRDEIKPGVTRHVAKMILEFQQKHPEGSGK